MVAAGTVRQEGQWAFWDVHDPERAVINPEAAAAAIRQAILN